MEILVALAIIVGLVGVILPALPGLLLAAAAIALWAGFEGVWWLLGMVVLIAGGMTVLKIVIPARTARDAASTSALVVGSILALVGMFVIPVVGAIAGFLLGVFGTELVRLRHPSPAWTATWTTTKSVGLTMALELFSVLVMASLWVGALLVGA